MKPIATLGLACADHFIGVLAKHQTARSAFYAERGIWCPDGHFDGGK
jgi:hypothetical protein